ncbi:MAG: virulence protein RhuM/Fic/DOC family protein [Saprospiraceae bacterium]|nr:virulence protein RhuM/Fic/DOC family protein [Saprospiraceae bacterium]MBK8297969.1 virulence protein RhuM/Fic/DOC family protein [Saprospiraceae bacterium]
MNEIVIYKTPDKKTEVEVRFGNDTVWLTQAQMAVLFRQTKQNISLHINNCFKEKELRKISVVKDSLTTAADGKKYKTKFYNLDVIISVGYRVKSIQGTQFRQWATQQLKNYLVQGYAINQKRLEELGKIVQLIDQGGKSENLQLTEAKGLLEILSNYTKSFVLLNQYDSHSIKIGKLNENISYEIQYDEAKTAIVELKKQLVEKKEATELFGNEKDESFLSSLQSIVQTFDGQYLYPSIEAQAAHLLYFVIKNHSFNDGNKRIGAFLFVWFLEKNKHRFKKSGELKINDNGLTAISLLVAQSKPEEKELMIQLIINLIADQ